MVENDEKELDARYGLFQEETCIPQPTLQQLMSVEIAPLPPRPYTSYHNASDLLAAIERQAYKKYER